jgi:hypothetical protein
MKTASQINRSCWSIVNHKADVLTPHASKRGAAMSSDKRYQLIYTGKMKPGLTADTVKSNLVLSMGISESKAERLLDDKRKVLKNCTSSVEAQVLADKFDQAGIICVVRETGRGSNPGSEASGESSLVRLLKNFGPAHDSDSPSLFKRLIKGGQRRKRA